MGIVRARQEKKKLVFEPSIFTSDVSTSQIIEWNGGSKDGQQDVRTDAVAASSIGFKVPRLSSRLHSGLSDFIQTIGTALQLSWGIQGILLN
jgi:hypothetical protein